MARKKSTVRRSKRQTSNFRISTKPPSRRLRVKSSQLVIPNKFRTSGIIQQLPNITPFPLFSSGDTTADQSRKNLDILQQMAQYQTKALTRKQEVEKSLSKFQKTIKELELETKLKNLHIPINLNEISDPLERERYEKLKKLKKILTDSQTANERKLTMMRLNNPQITSDGEPLNKPGKLIEPDFSAFDAEQSSRIKVNPIFPTVETPQYDTSALDSEYQAKDKIRKTQDQTARESYYMQVLGDYRAAYICIRYIIACILAVHNTRSLTDDIIEQPDDAFTEPEEIAYFKILCTQTPPEQLAGWQISVKSFYISLVMTLVNFLQQFTHASPEALRFCLNQLKQVNPTGNTIAPIQKILRDTLAIMEGREPDVNTRSQDMPRLDEPRPDERSQDIDIPRPNEPIPDEPKPDGPHTIMELKNLAITQNIRSYFPIYDRLARFIILLNKAMDKVDLMILPHKVKTSPITDEELMATYADMDPVIHVQGRNPLDQSIIRVFRDLIIPLYKEKIIQYANEHDYSTRFIDDVLNHALDTVSFSVKMMQKEHPDMIKSVDEQIRVIMRIISDFVTSIIASLSTGQVRGRGITNGKVHGRGINTAEFIAPRLYQMVKPARPMFMKAPAPDTQLNNQNEEYEKRKNFFKSRYELMYGKTPSREKIETAMPRRAEPLMLEHPIITDDKQVLAPNFFRLPFYKTSLKTL